MQNSIRLVCEISSREVDAGDGFVRVTCPDFDAAMNTELNRLSKAVRVGRRGVAKNAKRLLLEVALDGPLTLDEWEAWKNLMWARQRRAQCWKVDVFKRLVSSALPCM